MALIIRVICDKYFICLGEAVRIDVVLIKRYLSLPFLEAG